MKYQTYFLTNKIQAMLCLICLSISLFAPAINARNPETRQLQIKQPVGNYFKLSDCIEDEMLHRPLWLTALNPVFSKDEKCQWSGTIDAITTTKLNRTDKAVNDLADSTKTQTLESRETINVKVNSGAATAKVEYSQTDKIITEGEQFCGRNAQPSHAHYSDNSVTTQTGSGEGAAKLIVDINEAAKTFRITVYGFKYDIKTAFKKEITATCPGYTRTGDEQNGLLDSNSNIYMPDIPFDPTHPDILAGSKTLVLNELTTVTYNWNLKRCQSCGINVRDANTNNPLSEDDLKAYGFNANRPGGTQTLRTGAGQRLEITLKDGSVMRISPNSALEFNPCDETKPGNPIKVKTILGKTWYHITKALGGDNKFEVETERALVGVRGTTFEVSYDPKSTISTVHVIEGTVSFGDFNGENTIMVTGGQTAQMESDSAPTLVNSSANPTTKPPVKRKP
ncbi:MAG: FecR family protein [Acidobacteriota bacterium]|nr:FecR family protein [Acidobacteriota bacterium]